MCYAPLIFFCLPWCKSPSGPRPPHYWGFNWTHHTHTFKRLISSSQRPLLDNTQYSRQTSTPPAGLKSTLPYTYVRTYIRTHVYTYVCVCTYVLTYVCMYVYIYMYVCVSMYVRVYVCIYVCMCVLRMYVLIYVLCTCVCTYVWMNYVFYTHKQTVPNTNCSHQPHIAHYITSELLLNAKCSGFKWGIN